MTKTIASVLGFGTAEAGHAVEVELGLSDATRERLRCPEHLAPSLAQALLQASALAEKERATGQKQTLHVEMPYRATNITIGVALDASGLAIKFATAEGVPIVVAMPPALARQTVELLSVQLARLSTPQPVRKH